MNDQTDDKIKREIIARYTAEIDNRQIFDDLQNDYGISLYDLCTLLVAAGVYNGSPTKRRTITKPYICGNGERRPWTEDDICTIMRLRDEGLSHRQIAEAVGHPEYSLSQKFAELSGGREKPVGAKWDAKDVRMLRRCLAAGLTRTEIARELGRTYCSVRAKARKLGNGS